MMYPWTLYSLFYRKDGSGDKLPYQPICSTAILFRKNWTAVFASTGLLFTRLNHWNFSNPQSFKGYASKEAYLKHIINQSFTAVRAGSFLTRTIPAKGLKCVSTKPLKYQWIISGSLRFRRYKAFFQNTIFTCPLHHRLSFHFKENGFKY